MNSRAWLGRFDAVPWTVIAARFHGLAADHPQFQHLADIVDSVIACQAEHRLAGLTSMHDLIVTYQPIPEPPIEEIVVHSPSSGLVGPGAVLIEHRSATGHDDRIMRSVADAVPLFWRFVIEKFGIEPVRPEPSPEP